MPSPFCWATSWIPTEMREKIFDCFLSCSQQHRHGGLRLWPGNCRTLQITIHVSFHGPARQPGPRRGFSCLAASIMVSVLWLLGVSWAHTGLFVQQRKPFLEAKPAVVIINRDSFVTVIQVKCSTNGTSLPPPWVLGGHDKLSIRHEQWSNILVILLNCGAVNKH